VDFETVAAAVEGVPEPHIPAAQGRVIYDHVRETRPASVLELGTAHGVSAAYIAAALDANGEGHLTTVDSSQLTWANPTPGELLEAAGLRGRVSIDRSYSTYNWFLKEQVAAQSDDAGNCEPLYDFCFLDGQKNRTVDGLAVVLIQKLLRPGGWLLLDDLGWTYSPATTGFHYGFWRAAPADDRHDLVAAVLRAGGHALDASASRDPPRAATLSRGRAALEDTPAAFRRPLSGRGRTPAATPTFDTLLRAVGSFRITPRNGIRF
jgi:predicted O-methyltransferase YrrM